MTIRLTETGSPLITVEGTRRHEILRMAGNIAAGLVAVYGSGRYDDEDAQLAADRECDQRIADRALDIAEAIVAALDAPDEPEAA